MANCMVCGKKVGGFMGEFSPSSEQFDACEKAGVKVPVPICYKCFQPYLESAATGLPVQGDEELQALLEQKEEVTRIEVLTVDVPPFQYDSLGFISAHTALGTGPVTAIASSVTDLFGKQSGAYHQKIQEAESACLYRLRENADGMGADAIVGVRVTYTELTGGHSQLLVCMVGTAVKKHRALNV